MVGTPFLSSLRVYVCCQVLCNQLISECLFKCVNESPQQSVCVLISSWKHINRLNEGFFFHALGTAASFIHSFIEFQVSSHMHVFNGNRNPQHDDCCCRRCPFPFPTLTFVVYGILVYLPFVSYSKLSLSLSLSSHVPAHPVCLLSHAGRIHFVGLIFLPVFFSLFPQLCATAIVTCNDACRRSIDATLTRHALRPTVH